MRVIYCDQGVATALEGEVILALCNAPMNAGLLRKLEEALEVAVRERGERVVSITVLRRGVMENPAHDSDKLRSSVAPSMGSADQFLRAGALVIDAEGFLAAAVRSSITGLLLLARPKVLIKVFANDKTALEWLLPLGSDPKTHRAHAEVSAALASLLAMQDRRTTVRSERPGAVV